MPKATAARARVTARPAAVEIGGARPVTIADVLAVARFHAPVAVAPSVDGRLRAARAHVERAVAEGAPVYGLTTGLGAAVDTALPAHDIAAFQARAVAARAVGVGVRLTTEEVRATLLVRLAGLAQGVSGITPGFVPALRDILNAGLHPVAHRTGSLGESDLAPLAELMLPFAGGGEAELDGVVRPGPEALARAGITAPRLGPKDGIALINASAASTALAALAVADLAVALDALTGSAALALEGFRANLSILDPRVVALHPAPGQAEGVDRLRALLAGSALWEPGAARRLQDPLSFRCVAPVHGAALVGLDRAREAVEAELATAGDSPAILAEDGLLLSTVNFDTTALALALGALAQAAAHAAALAPFRIAKLMSEDLTGLPRFLARERGTRTGFATAQKTASALEAEIRRLAVPVGPMTAPVADGIEDYAPMTPLAAEAVRTIADRLRLLAAVELAVAAQAVDLRRDLTLGRGTQAIQGFVRARVAPLAEDRPTGPDFRDLADAIAAGELRAALGRDA
ncbi:MAG: histidine ammonia-lyase [Methylobacteriaceae bacterium]|nr:histidine ammonia-lyase [Methylobacteriaceae bacterium]